MNRRQFVKDLGISTAALPFLAGLPGLHGASSESRPLRLVIMFSPNGTIPKHFWPDQQGSDFQLKRIMKPLEAFKKELLVLKGVSNKVKGDGDRHMRGMSCLLTGTELFPGNIQGGSDTPAGWASGISIDQELKNFLQTREDTRTRFGSLEFGVEVPNRADPWTRMSYAGANMPLAPIDDPRQMFAKLYGQMKDKDDVVSVIDTVTDDLKRVTQKLGSDDRRLLEQHLTLVRKLEQDLQSADTQQSFIMKAPDVDPEIELTNDNTPELSRTQIDLLVSAMANNMTRVATLQYMRSVGQAQMKWLGVEDGHHGLSHKPDSDASAVEKLTKINEWFCGELAYLTKRLNETPEPGHDGSMLDHTLIVWLNELGKGNNHTLDNIPFILVGGKHFGFKSGRALDMKKAAHNRLWLTVANAMGHGIESFGTQKYCEGGALNLS